MSRPQPRQGAPELAFDTLDGAWRLSDARPKNFTLIVAYRGLHCPICKKQLRELDRQLDAFAELGTEVLAVSVDGRERAQRTKEEWRIRNLTIGYGLDEATARAWGLYVSTAIKDGEPDRFFEPGLFLVRPDGTVYAAWIQSTPFARPTLDDLLGGIKFIVENEYPARGEA